jgi:chromosome partitioning protein
MGRVISIVNQKGGVGKTTTAVNLSSALARIGRKVLVVDIDPQGNATSGLGVDKNGLEANLYDVFLGIFSLSSILVGTAQPSLWVAPSNSDLVGVEVELAGVPGRELRLRNQLERLRTQFDYVFLDCPPSLGLLTINALVASDAVLVPLQCEYYALEGISSLMQTIALARQQLNPNLELEGVVLTMYDSRTNLARQVGAEARKFFAESVFQVVIPRNVRLSECPSFGQPIFLYDDQSVGAEAYSSLALELEKRRNARGPLEGEGENESASEGMVANRAY